MFALKQKHQAQFVKNFKAKKYAITLIKNQIF